MSEKLSKAREYKSTEELLKTRGGQEKLNLINEIVSGKWDKIRNKEVIRNGKRFTYANRYELHRGDDTCFWVTDFPYNAKDFPAFSETLSEATGMDFTKEFTKKGFAKKLTNFYNQATKEVIEPKENEIKEWQDIPDLDAQVRTIREPTEDFNEWIVEIGLQESLGEQGGDILTLFCNEKPALEQIRNDIIKQYEETKTKINEEVAMGITAKSGRDEMIEVAIDKVLL